MNRFNMGMNYNNQGYAGRMGSPAMQFMNQGHGRQMMRPGMNMRQNMQGQMGQRGMNMMPNMQGQIGQRGMNMMPGMQNHMNQMPQQGMSMMPNMQGQMSQMNQMSQPNMNQMPNTQSQTNHLPQPGNSQSIDGVTFEPYNPAGYSPTGHQPQATTPNITPPTTGNDENPSFTTPPQSAESDSARILSNFIQGEKNAHRFYSELAELADSKHAQRVIARIQGNTDKRRKFFCSLYNRMSGMAYSEKDLPIIKSHNFTHGLRTAIEIETDTIMEMADLYEKFENGASQRTFNSLIQKKIADVISLQMLLV